MGPFEAVVVFVICWWLVLFPMLSAGTRSQAEDGDVIPGTDPGAPVAARLLPKMLITTAVSAALTLLIFLTIRFHWLDAVLAAA